MARYFASIFKRCVLIRSSHIDNRFSPYGSMKNKCKSSICSDWIPSHLGVKYAHACFSGREWSPEKQGWKPLKQATVRTEPQYAMTCGTILFLTWKILRLAQFFEANYCKDWASIWHDLWHYIISYWKNFEASSVRLSSLKQATVRTEPQYGMTCGTTLFLTGKILRLAQSGSVLRRGGPAQSFGRGVYCKTIISFEFNIWL